MKYHVLTLFPEMILQGLAPSIIGRALENHIISLEAVNIRDFSAEKHKKVDDYTYGGGAGMLMQAQPVYDAWKSVCGEKKLRTIYVTPQGRPFTQKMAQDFSGEEELVFLCGHYEGIDERVLEETVTDYVSVGDYVLTGGELPAMVIIDAVSRLVPGVLGNDVSAEEESFNNDLLEYPQYSRPVSWHGKEVPQVLLSGNHRNIVKWRLEQSIEKTRRVRPDLYEKYEEKQRLIKQLGKEKRNNIHIMESLARGKGEILYWQGKNLMVYDADSRTCMADAENKEQFAEVYKASPAKITFYLTRSACVKDFLLENGHKLWGECTQVLYTAKEMLPVNYKDIRPLTMENAAYVTDHYGYDEASYVTERILAGAMWGAFDGEKLVGFIGLHGDGSLGLLYVDEDYRRKGIAASLQAYGINRLVEQGYVPYGHILDGNEASLALQEKMGMYVAGQKIWWIYPLGE